MPLMTVTRGSGVSTHSAGGQSQLTKCLSAQRDSHAFQDRKDEHLCQPRDQYPRVHPGKGGCGGGD